MKIQAVGENLLGAIAYGDAAGLPYETKPHQTEGSVTELPPLTSNPFLDVPAELKDARGVWSDDTHLSLASVLSLIRYGGFDLEDQALAHIQAIEHVRGSDELAELVPPIVTESRRNGYGRSTMRSVERLQEGMHPTESGEAGGAGNGVLMKLAPLVYYQYARDTDPDAAFRQVEQFTRMTHDSDDAVVSSQIHRVMLTQLMSIDPNDPDALKYLLGFYYDATYLADAFEGYLPNATATSEWLRRLRDSLNLGEPAELDRATILDSVSGEKGGGFFAPETLMMAYGSFLREPHYPECVYRAVELGGDTDSIASIVGSMAVCLWGDVPRPADEEHIFAGDRLREVSTALTQVALKEGT